MNYKQSQRIFKRQLIHTCDIYSKKRMRLDGEWVYRYVQSGKKLRCRMSTLVRQNTEGEPNLRHEFITPYRLYLLPTDVKEDDIIHFKGNFYVAKTKPINPSFLDHHYEVPCDTTDDDYNVIEVNGVVMLDAKK